MDLLVRSCQAALFGTIDIRNPLEVGHHIKSGAGDLLDGEPLILPLPVDAPLEIPRIVLKSKDGRYSCNISGVRLDLFYRDKSPSQKWNDIQDEYLQHLSTISQTALQIVRARITRLGAVAEFEIPINASPSLSIRKGYLKEGILPGEHEVQIGVLHRQSWDMLEINRWVRLRGKEGESAMRVVVDINTIPEKEYQFNVDDMESFYNRISNFYKDNLHQIIFERTGLEI